MVGSSLRIPRSAPGSPTLLSPVRKGSWPVMKAERPAVQLCWRVVGHELPAFLRQPVDVRRAVSHHALVVGAEVPDADVIAHDDQDVRLLDRISLLGRRWIPRRARGQQDRPPGSPVSQRVFTTGN